MWVQLLRNWFGDSDGKVRTHYPGEWVDIGKQAALKLIAEGGARSSRPIQVELPPLSGAVLTGNAELGRALLGKIKDLKVAEGEPALLFERTLIWDGRAGLPLDLIGVGLAHLETRQAALIISSYETQAKDFGDDADRELTRSVIHDLRVPTYEPGAMFLRRCPEAERLLELWREESARGSDGRLALLRAVYRSLIRFEPLPATWCKQ